MIYYHIFIHLNYIFIYQMIFNISLLKLRLLLIKMVKKDSLNFMTGSRRVFWKEFMHQ